MQATNFAELFGAVFASSADVRSGVSHGPTGDEITGALQTTATMPPSADTAIGRLVTYSNGSPISDVSVSIQAIATDGGCGVVDTGDVITEVSDDSGLVEFVMFRGWTYRVWEGVTKRMHLIVVPSNVSQGLTESGVFNISSVVGVND